MSILSEGDWSPIASAIKSFGTGIVNNALKKQELRRQLGQDIVAYDKDQAAIDASRAAAGLTRAKTDSETWGLDQRKKLAAGYDPTALSADERLTTSIAAMLGSKSAQDAMNAAGTRSRTRMSQELFNSDNPVERFAGATGRVVTPYRVDPVSGTVVNQLTGQVDLSPMVLKGLEAARDAGLRKDYRASASGGTGGGTAAGSVSSSNAATNAALAALHKVAGVLKQDDFGNTKIEMDPEVTRKIYQGAIAAGVDTTDAQAMLKYYFDNLPQFLPAAPKAAPAADDRPWYQFWSSGNEPAQTPVASPAPSAPPKSPKRSQADAAVDQLLEELTLGRITQEEFEDRLSQLKGNHQ